MTRWVEERCDNCGNKKEIYYKPWCSLCEMPEVQVVKTLNLLQCFRFIERNFFDQQNDYPELPERREIWTELCENNWITNDSTSGMPFVMWVDEPDSYGNLSEEAIKYLTKLVEVFDLRGDNENVQWEVSW